MATSFGFRPNDRPLLYNAKYQCNKCGHKWKVRRTSGESKRCPIETCTSLPVFPYKKIAIDKLVVYQCPSCKTNKKETRCSEEVNQLPYCTVCRCDMTVVSCKNIKELKRKYGKFRCHKCGRSWESGNSWEGKGQMCKRCNVMVWPYSLEPLKPPVFLKDKKEPHDEARCQMCQQLGYCCKRKNTVAAHTVASADELPEEDDMRSVLTDTSSLQDTTSREESLTPPESLSGDATPTENDEYYREEIIISEATRHLANIQLSNK